MRKKLKIGLMIAAGVLVGLSVADRVIPRTASLDLGGDRKLDMQIWSLAGLNSEWSRRFVISSDADKIPLNAMVDTGWWRGTPVYQAEDGRVLISDFDFVSVWFCDGTIMLEAPPSTTSCEVPLADPFAPVSVFDGPAKGMHFLGVFQPPKGIWGPRFRSWRDHPELPSAAYDPGG